MRNFQDILQKIQEAKEPVALCIIVAVKGSTPRKEGAKMLVYESGKFCGTIGGGNLEKKVIENALAVIKKNEPQLFRHDLLHQHSMCCGGTVDVYIEPIMKKNKLYIFGAGHTGQALAKYAVDMEFEVVMIDDRKEYIDQITIEGVNKMNLNFEQALSLLPFDKQTYITIMTYEHSIDRNILAFCIKKVYAYLGMIGSLRKVELTKKMFIESGLASKEKLDTVEMPMGLNKNSESPEEIAISILAKLIQTNNSK